jgi:hypothetical protein
MKVEKTPTPSCFFGFMCGFHHKDTIQVSIKRLT